MSPYALAWWTILAAAVVVLIMVTLQAVRAWREIKRLNARIEAMSDLPVVIALARGAADARRIDAAIAEFPTLLERAKVATAVIRRGPLPPELFVAIARLRAEIAAFRKFAAR